MAKYLATLTISALLLGGVTRGWAGSGDIDPGFGSGGRVEGSYDTASLLLPDDRLVTAHDAGDLLVRRFDANGKVDSTFSDGGEAFISLPDGWSNFVASYAAHTLDGGLLFAGTLWPAGGPQVLEAVLRLDRDGRLVTSFGGRGDGFYRLTETPVGTPDGGMLTSLIALAVDGDGRVLLAERSWAADGRCGSTKVVRLTPSGTPDGAFGTNGRADVPGVDLCDGVALFGARADGSIVVGANGTIVALDASGAIIAGSGVNGHLYDGLPGNWRGQLLPDGGLVLVSNGTAEGPNDISIFKLDSSGHPDATFGSGTGSLVVDLGTVLLGDASASEQIERLVLGTDAFYLYLQVKLCRSDGCLGGIVRLSRDGTPDDTFGNRGLTILGYTSGDHGGFQSLSLFAAQATGAPLFRGMVHSSPGPSNDDPAYAVYRLLVDATPSPGFLTVVSPVTNANVDEPTRTASITVARLAGRDGPLSVDYGTQDGSNIGEAEGRFDYYGAQAGIDYEMASGRLDWADGDDGQRTVTISIIDDDLFEAYDWFRVAISDPTGSSLIWGSAAVVLIVDDENPHTPLSPGPPTAANGSGSGGGGALSWATLLGVSGLLLRRRGMRPIAHWTAPRRCDATRRLASIVALLSALFVLTVFGIARMPSGLTNQDHAARDASTQPRLIHFPN